MKKKRLPSVDVIEGDYDNIDKDKIVNQKSTLKVLSDFDIAKLKKEEEKKEEIEKVKTTITQFIYDKLSDTGLEENAVNSFIQDIFKYNDVRSLEFINEIKVKDNISHQKLAEIAHFIGKSLNWSGDDIAKFAKKSFETRFKTWELTSIKGILSSKLSNKKKKKK